MAKDDYQVIVFRILKYLYLQLKKGLPVEAEMLRHDSKICKINEPYWRYIITSMQDEGLIKCLSTKAGQADDVPLEDRLGNLQITPKGIEMLSDSRMAEKVDNLLRGILSIG